MGRNNKRKRKEKKVQFKEQDLDRFAGSSEEEEEAEPDDDEVVQKTTAEDDASFDSGDEKGKESKEEPVNDEVNEDEESDSDEEEDEEDQPDEDEILDQAVPTASGAMGMANAMLRILGSAPSKKEQLQHTAVLSKTTTPLQRQAQEEKKHEQELKEKRKSKRERNLKALHVPLSVATSNEPDQNAGEALVKELERERLYRRVATRGVVALFNAITQHQQKQTTETTAANRNKTEDKKADVKKMTKHGFLDMIKTAATAGQVSKDMDRRDDDDDDDKEQQKPKADAPTNTKWKALQSDYLLGTKKNWDQESSDEDEHDDEVVNDDWSDDEAENQAVRSKGSKKRRVGAQ